MTSVRNCDLEFVMSRSVRSPYAAITGAASAKEDKRNAHRGERRKQNYTLKACEDFDDLILPHRYECSGNNVYCWDSDGGKSDFNRWRYSTDAGARSYYLKLLRK